jgi:hypothetical protein
MRNFVYASGPIRNTDRPSAIIQGRHQKRPEGPADGRRCSTDYAATCVSIEFQRLLPKASGRFATAFHEIPRLAADHPVLLP